MNALVPVINHTNHVVALPMMHVEHIKFRHYRRVNVGLDSEGRPYEAINPCGGATVAYAETSMGIDGTNGYLIGVAYCNPVDNYCKKYGRAKAEGRLIQFVYHGKSSSYEDDKHIFIEADDEKEMLVRLDAYMEDMDYLPR